MTWCHVPGCHLISIDPRCGSGGGSTATQRPGPALPTATGEHCWAAGGRAAVQRCSCAALTDRPGGDGACRTAHCAAGLTCCRGPWLQGPQRRHLISSARLRGCEQARRAYTVEAREEGPGILLSATTSVVATALCGRSPAAVAVDVEPLRRRTRSGPDACAADQLPPLPSPTVY